jgi:phospholipid/cholesterol/gamma-HCH transport system ATP-binding protein
LNEQEIQRKVSKALSFVNLDGTQHLLPDELSGGMKKRVAIARALVFEPEIILYDEPTSGLDPINARSVLELIQLLKDNGSTSVVVTHNLNDAVLIGDCHTLINNGNIVETGTTKTLLDSENKFVREFFYELHIEADLLRNKQIINE